MNVRELWVFVAGESRFAPACVVVAIAAAAVIRHAFPGATPFAGPVFVAIIALGFIAALSERV